MMNLKSMTYRMGTTEPVGGWTSYSFDYKNLFVQNFLFARTRIMQEQGRLYNKVLINYNNIYGFKINGRFYPCPIQKNLPDFKNCCIGFSDQEFYFIVVTKDAIMTFDSNTAGNTPAIVEFIFD